MKVSEGIKTNAESTANAEVAAKLKLTEVLQECTTADKDVSEALLGLIQARSNSGKAEKPEELFDDITLTQGYTCPNSKDTIQSPPPAPQHARQQIKLARQPTVHEETLTMLDKLKRMRNRQMRTLTRQLRYGTTSFQNVTLLEAT